MGEQMTTRQFYFSCLSGLALAVAGALLATAGSATWGLSWVGTAITGLALSYRLDNKIHALRARLYLVNRAVTPLADNP
jgi:hypothetical protein